MITCPTVRKETVRGHYDLSTLFYWMFWGRHIHHGYWEADESPAVAQQQLIDKMSGLLDIQSSDRVLDIGCGMGGSSIELATRGCSVVGVTLSPFQRRWASTAARLGRVSRQTRFIAGDVEQIDLPAEDFDVAWSIECTEHLFDKPRLFQRIVHWLRPEGRVGICAWLAGAESQQPPGRDLVYRVCDDFFCPSLGTAADYAEWMREAGLEDIQFHDWTDHVVRTWEICLRRTRRSGVRLLAQAVDRDTVRFLDAFETILKAYQTGAIQYGCITATKPPASTQQRAINNGS